MRAPAAAREKVINGELPNKDSTSAWGPNPFKYTFSIKIKRISPSRPVARVARKTCFQEGLRTPGV
jgi:hypothetical protein